MNSTPPSQLALAIEKALVELNGTKENTSMSTPQHSAPPLPSAFQPTPRWRPPPKKSKKNDTKTPKNRKIYTKNIVCLVPVQDGTSKPLSIPRGEARANLTEHGLVGKINIEYSMSAEDIHDEICSLFKDCFAADGLNYSYLSIMPGTKKLHIPKTTKAFVWDAPQVLSICTRDTLYILSSSNPIVSTKNESVSDEDSSDESLMHPVFGDSKGNTCRNENADANISSSSNIFSSYASLINKEIIEIPSDEDEVDHKSESDNSQTLTPITDILDKLQAPLTESNSVSSINIRRQFVLEDTIRFLKRKRFDEKATISVRFADDHGVGEGAIDAGGPRREFLRLLVKAVNEQSGVFCGPIDGRTLQANASAREKDLYRFTGTILAWAIVHGGPAPRFFSTSLYNALSSNGVTVVRKEDIADPSLKECVYKIASSSNLEELRKNLSVPEISTILEAQGVATALIKSIDDKDWLCNLIARHIIVDAPRSFLEDLKSGLETLGVLQKMHEFQEEFRDIFVPSKSNSKIDAQTIDSLFVIDYAEMGSNLRSKQEIAVVYWRDYLQDCECGSESKATLKDVMVFITGAEEPPPLGFDSYPTIEFTDDRLPTANTCGTVLRLPTSYTQYDDFKEAIDFAILNSPCFGQI